MSTEGAEHPIRVVALRTGLTPHVIRIWERRYQAVAPARTSNNRRFYTNSEIERLTLLRRATLLGRSIGQVAKLSTSQLKTLLKRDEAASRIPLSIIAPATESNAGSYIEKCLEAIDRLDSTEFLSILNRAAVVLSRAALLEEVILPLLVRIGDLWESGSFSIVHEHFASSILRTFIAKFTLVYEIPASSPLLIVATPAGELHELGALAAAATATSEGWRVAYLGPNLPADEMIKAAHQLQSRAIAVSVVYSENSSEIRKEFAHLRKLLPQEITLIAGGSKAPSYATILRDMGGIVVSDLSTFRNELRRLRSVGPS